MLYQSSEKILRQRKYLSEQNIFDFCLCTFHISLTTCPFTVQCNDSLQFQREKEDVIIEMERNKDELSKEKTSNKILNEEKDMNNKEFERLLEKYDR